LNCVPDHDTEEEEVVTLSLSDLDAELPSLPPSIPRMLYNIILHLKLGTYYLL